MDITLTKSEAYCWGYSSSYVGAAKDQNPFNKNGSDKLWNIWNHAWWDARRGVKTRSKFWKQYGKDREAWAKMWQVTP